MLNAKQSASPLPRFPQLEREPLHERVYRELRRALMAGRFVPGQKLTVRGLAAALGTSPSPIRSSLSRLVAEQGLIQLQNGSVAVPVMTRERFKDLMLLRMLIEGLATERAAAALDADSWEEIAANGVNLDASTAAGDIVGYLDSNQKLKFSIYRHCHSRPILELIEILWLQVGPFLRHFASDFHGLLKTNHHDDVLAALRIGDGAAARAALMRDIREGMELLLLTAEFAPEESEAEPIAASALPA